MIKFYNFIIILIKKKKIYNKWYLKYSLIIFHNHREQC